jgi:hypothetical protein
VWADIGSVTELTGAATIKRGSSNISVARDTKIQLNDRVETKSGRVKITFKDSTTVTVTESSALLIDDFVYDPKSSGGKLGLKTVAGTVRYVSGNIAHNNPNSVNIKTPTASIAVRGTDFVMSVDETGKSLVVLMPTCETEQNVNLKGLSCGSGRIDVESGGRTVVLDKPYQATIVETIGQAPLPPVTVNFHSSQIGNNLMIDPPKSSGGQSIQRLAKQVAQKTGDGERDDREESKKEAQHAAQHHNSNIGEAQRKDTEEAGIRAAALSKVLEDNGITVTNTSTNQRIYRIYQDASNTRQIGWGYEALSPSGYNYTNIGLPISSKALVVVTQDRITDAFNSNSESARSYGTIIINQQYR